MAKLKDLEDCEREVEGFAKRKVKEGKVLDANVESTKITGRGRRGKYPTYLMRGHVIYKQKGRIKSRIIKKEFTAQVNAISGRIIEFAIH